MFFAGLQAVRAVSDAATHLGIVFEAGEDGKTDVVFEGVNSEDVFCGWAYRNAPLSHRQPKSSRVIPRLWADGTARHGPKSCNALRASPPRA